MAMAVIDQHGRVVLPPKLKHTQDGRSYAELVVDFGDSKQDHWYVRVWKDHLVAHVMRTATKDAYVAVSGTISKWGHGGGGYGVAVNAENIEAQPKALQGRA